MKNSGFTLIEIIVALFIFAILGTIVAISLHTVLQNYQRVERVDKQLQKLQMMVTLMRRDISQIVDRPVSDITGEILPAFFIDKVNHIEFTTGGHTNPFALENRSSLRRVAYEWNGKQLTRLTWSVLDRSAKSKPLSRILLSSVTKFRLSFLDDQGKISVAWPPTDKWQAHISAEVFPRAIIVALTLDHQRTMRLVFPIVARGWNAS